MNTNSNKGKNTLNKTAVKKEELELEDVNTNSSLTIDDVGRSWTEILEKFKSRRAMIIYASIVTAKPYSFKNGIVTLEYDSTYAFNKARLEKEEYKKTVNEVFSEALNEKVAVKYIIKEDDSIEENKEQLLKQKLDGEIPFEVYDE